MIRLQRESEKVARDIHFGGTKREVYDRLANTYLLENYRHPIITRSYLRSIDLNEYGCPRQEHEITYKHKLPIQKRALYVLLKDQLRDLGIRPEALPSKKWLIAALNYAEIQPDLIADIKRISELSQTTTTPDTINDITLTKQRLKETCSLLNIETYEAWREAITEIAISKLMELTEVYSFLQTTDEIVDKLTN